MPTAGSGSSKSKPPSPPRTPTEQAARVRQEFTLANLREGEDSIDRLWYAYREALAVRASAQPLDQATREQIRRDHPVPPAYDFRLNAQTPTGSTSSGIPDSTE